MRKIGAVLACASVALALACTSVKAEAITYAVTSDTRIDSYYTTSNYGSSDSLKLIINSANKNSGSYVRVLIDLPDTSTILSDVTSTSSISSAKLWVYLWWINPASGETFADRGITAYALTTAFTESGATFATCDGTNAWTTAGGDYDSSTAVTFTASDSVDPDTNLGWYYFDLTALYQSGYDLSDGLILMLDPETCPTASSTWCTYVLDSSEVSGTAPYLEITAVPEPATIVALSFGLVGLGLVRRRVRKNAVGN